MAGRVKTPAEAVDEAAGRVRKVRVRCTAGYCTAQASGEVALREVAPGIVERPRYVCGSCGCELKEERGAAS